MEQIHVVPRWAFLAYYVKKHAVAVCLRSISGAPSDIRDKQSIIAVDRTALRVKG